jgi:hypothetical protein
VQPIEVYQVTAADLLRFWFIWALITVVAAVTAWVVRGVLDRADDEDLDVTVELPRLTSRRRRRPQTGTLCPTCFPSGEEPTVPLPGRWGRD